MMLGCDHPSHVFSQPAERCFWNQFSPLSFWITYCEAAFFWVRWDLGGGGGGGEIGEGADFCSHSQTHNCGFWHLIPSARTYHHPSPRQKLIGHLVICIFYLNSTSCREEVGGRCSMVLQHCNSHTVHGIKNKRRWWGSLHVWKFCL